MVRLLPALPCRSPQESIAAQSRASLRGPHRSRSQDEEAKAMALVNHHGGDVCHARTDGAKRQPAERTCRLYSIGVE